MTRNEARTAILTAANLFSLAQHRRRQMRTRRALPFARIYGARHIQEAVCIVRRNDLVPGAVLETAGFNRRFSDPAVRKIGAAA